MSSITSCLFTSLLLVGDPDSRRFPIPFLHRANMTCNFSPPVSMPYLSRRPYWVDWQQ